MLGTASADDELFCATFSSLAQSCRTYEEYVERMGRTPSDDLELAGLALHGPARRVNRLVGALPLFR